MHFTATGDLASENAPYLTRRATRWAGQFEHARAVG
jgi:hypothetical protein